MHRVEGHAGNVGLGRLRPRGPWSPPSHPRTPSAATLPTMPHDPPQQSAPQTSSSHARRRHASVGSVSSAGQGAAAGGPPPATHVGQVEHLPHRAARAPMHDVMRVRGGHGAHGVGVDDAPLRLQPVVRCLGAISSEVGGE